ncbi:MAG: efflux RND transporter periplasmic adaptor subunit [Verrucomicrobia bacterium]|nr:efflux RND transporter periplasmic adaptor subunit [Verrucomicrobiota bacterium]
MLRMKPLIIVLAIAFVAGGGWYLNSSRQPHGGPATVPSHGISGDASRASSTAVVESRDIQFTVSAAGEITPAEQVSVRPEINGRIATLLVDIGDRVKKGDTFFTLDDRDLQIEKETQDKEIERTRVQMAQAERNYLRNKQLFEDKLIAQEVFEEQRTQLELAKNSHSKAEKSLELLMDRLRKTRLVAPFDCTVLTRPVSVGQSVSGSGGFNSGTEVLSIADLNQLIINAHIKQADITRLRVNQEVEISVEAIPGLKVMGLVERIAPQATIRNNIKGFSARILLRNVDPRIRPSMTANIRIPVSSAENVLSVPLAAVFTELNPDTQQMERFVYVKTAEGFDRRLVQVGVSDYFYAEVQSGLGAGDVVSLEEPKGEAERRSKARELSGDRKSITSAPAATSTTNSAKPTPPSRPAQAAGS